MTVPPPPGSPLPADTPRSGVSRAGRVRDGVALLLVVIGIGLVLGSHAGMQRLATKTIVVPKGEWAVTQFSHYYYVELAGYVTAVVGIAVGAWSYLLHARRGRSDAAGRLTS